MKNTFKVFGLVLIIQLYTLSAIAGGGWPPKKGHGFLKLAQWWVVSDQHFTSNGAIDPNVTNGIFNTSIYGEFGITDKFSVTAYIPFFSRAYVNNIVSGTTGETLTAGEAINSFGDTDLTFSYGLTSGAINTSASITFGLPLGNDSGGSEGNLQTGDGEFNQMLRVDAGFGYRIGQQNAYFSSYVGFNNRTKGFSDEIRYGVETGASFANDRLLFIVRLFGSKSLFNGVENAFATGTSLFANNAEFLSISPEINYNIGKNWGVSANFAAALSGKLIFASPSYSFGVYSKF